MTERSSLASFLRRRWRPTTRRQWAGFLFVLPIFVLFVVFRFSPMVQAFWLSLYDYDLLGEGTYVGLGNYVRLAHDPLFIQSLGVSAYYVVGTCIPLWILALALALLLDLSIRGKGILRVAFFLPAIVPTVVVPILWRFLYHPYGLVNSIMENVGLHPVAWLTSVEAVIPAFIITSEWRFIPLFMIIYLAGLQGIPGEYYEAAKIDGANYLQRFVRITLPLLRPTILVVIITSVIFTARSLVLALLMTGGAPGGASRVLSLFIYQNGFSFFKLGYASAASMVLLLILGIFTVIQLRLLRSAD